MNHSPRMSFRRFVLSRSLVCAGTCVAVATTALAQAQSRHESRATALPFHAEPVVSFPNDSVCSTIQLSGTVMDTTHNIKVGLWVHDRLDKGAKAARTDSTGTFHLTVDAMPRALYVFADSASWQANHLMGLGETDSVQVKNCVAAPVTLVLESLADLLGNSKPKKEDIRTWRLTVRPHTMATGDRTAQAGVVTLAGFPNYALYAPPACVGTRRCPLVVILHGAGYSGSEMIDLERPAADKYGTLIFAPTSVAEMTWKGDSSRVVNQKYIDSAITYILKNYAVDPDKLAIIGRCNGGAFALGWGGANPEVFSRVVIISGAYTEWVNLVDPTNKTSQFLVDAGYTESAEDFTLVHALRQAGHPVKKIIGLRGHEHQVEDYDFVGHLLQESWAIPNPAARPVPVTMDSVPLLTTNALLQLRTFWTTFAKLPDSISTTARRAYMREVSVPFGTERGSIIMTDVELLARQYPAVADVLKMVGLTPHQEEAYRAAFVQAMALRDMRDVTSQNPMSVATQNVNFLQSHPDEVRDAELPIREEP